MDEWVLPNLAKMPGISVDVVDVSGFGGIADPGPESPPFSGADGQRNDLSTLTAMEANLRQYVDVYHLGSTSMHFYVAPSNAQAQWQIPALPTLAGV
jgi:hypothetical protein